MGGHDETVDRARVPDIPVDWRALGRAARSGPRHGAGHMSDDMLNLAIPSVARDLHATAAGVQWILLAIIVLPALAGLAGAGSLGGAVLAEAYPRALRAAAVLAVVGIPVALLTLPGGGPATRSLPGSAPGSRALGGWVAEAGRGLGGPAPPSSPGRRPGQGVPLQPLMGCAVDGKTSEPDPGLAGSGSGGAAVGPVR